MMLFVCIYFRFLYEIKLRARLNCLHVGSITTWKDMAKAFLIKYFPPSKTMKLRADITTLLNNKSKN